MKNHGPRKSRGWIAGVCVLMTWQSCHSLAAETTNFSDVRVQCTRVTEQRVTSNCVVELTFTGDALMGKMGVLGTTVIRAEDDLGNDLRLPRDPFAQSSGVAGDRSLAVLRGWFDVNARRQRYSGVALRPVAQTAKQIKELQGELILYSPTYTNGGVVVCEDFGRTPGTVFRHPGLEQCQVQLTWHTKESYQAEQLAAREHATITTTSGPDPGRLFPSWSSESKDASRNYLVLRADDPRKMIIAFAVREPGGRFLPIGNRGTAGNYHGLYFDTPLPEKLDLFVYLAVPAAIEKLPFQLENVPLPGRN